MNRKKDFLGEGFYFQEINPSDKGEANPVAILVSKQCARKSKKAIFYLHGFVDYFFQKHLAEKANEEGYNFYALDLHFCGRSIREGQIPHFCKDVSEYYPEISSALKVIREQDRNETIIGNFHSTGGPIGLLYAEDHINEQNFNGLILNSPFLKFNDSWINEEILIKLVASFASIIPEKAMPGGLSPVYGQSVHKNFHGEWDFNLAWKPIEGFPTYAGWIRAIVQAHERIQKGLNLNYPILSMFSTESSRPKEFNEIVFKTDCVLDILDIARYSITLGHDVTLKPIRNGMHDLILSPEPVRSLVLKEMFSWLSYKIS